MCDYSRLKELESVSQTYDDILKIAKKIKADSGKYKYLGLDAAVMTADLRRTAKHIKEAFNNKF